MLLRDEIVNKAENGKYRYDCLVDTTADLAGLDYMGLGSMALIRSLEPGVRVFVRTAEGWEPVGGIED